MVQNVTGICRRSVLESGHQRWPSIKLTHTKIKVFASNITSVWRACTLCSSSDSDQDVCPFKQILPSWSWTKWTNVDGQLFLVMLPEKVSPVPVDVLHTMKCGCASAEPCSSSRCSCVQAQISCSMFCTCHAEKECSNVHTRTCSTLPRDDEDADDDWVIWTLLMFIYLLHW